MSLDLDRRSPKLDQVAPDAANLDRIASGFTFLEGPVWRNDHLFFWDVPSHRIVRWRQLAEGPEVGTFRTGMNFPRARSSPCVPRSGCNREAP